ncbi:hypothetical protein pb186bvf_000778 [Paramecium bursaria]
MDQDFVQTPQKTRLQLVTIADLQYYSDERKIVVFYGFPHDEGTIRNKGRPGGSGAYDQIMAALVLPQVDYPILSLEVQSPFHNPISLEEAHIQLYQHVAEIYNLLPQALVIVLGGSNDQSYHNFKGLIDGTGTQKVGVINLDAHLDVRPLIDGKAHSGSPFRQMLEDQDRFKQSQFVEFGIKGCNCSKKHYEYVLEKGGKVVFMEKDIRRIDSDNQALKAFNDILTGWEDDDTQYIFVSFDIDSINSAWCPGVSAPSIVGGFTQVEAISMMGRAAKSKKLKLVDLSEFNPAVECVRTAKLIATMLYEQKDYQHLFSLESHAYNENLKCFYMIIFNVCQYNLQMYLILQISSL